MPSLSHVDDEGRARMVDVGHKPDQRRVARASGKIRLAPATVALVAENGIKKGDVLAVAEIAGVQAAKKTAELIPLCHTLNLSGIKVVARLDSDGVTITAEVSSTGQTGVEMEALSAVSVALLTVYDMCKGPWTRAWSSATSCCWKRPKRISNRTVHAGSVAVAASAGFIAITWHPVIPANAGIQRSGTEAGRIMLGPRVHGDDEIRRSIEPAGRKHEREH